MKRIANRGFTLIEMLTVMLIIAVLAALILGIHGFVNAKSSRARAEGEIQAISAAIEAYKADNGSVPRLPYPGTGNDASAGTEGAVSGTVGSLTQATPPISPILNGDPTSSAYRLASKYLYGQLTGDVNYNGLHDSGEGTAYLTFKPDQLGKPATTSGPTDRTVAYLQDPYGNSYGYSTAAATDEECFQQNVAANSSAVRAAPATGFNSTFDLWSTGGRVNQTMPNGTVADGSTNDPNTVWSRWVKNW